MIYNFTMSDKNRVDFPDCLYSKFKSKGQTAAAFAWNARCNLEYLYVHSPTNTTGVWLMIFDISVDEVQNLPGSIPDVAPYTLTSKANIVIAPTVDSYLVDDRVYLGLGMPFDKGIYICVSSTEETYTASELPVQWTGRVFSGDSGRIPACNGGK